MLKVLITGASRGIGQALVRRYREAGFSVVAVGATARFDILINNAGVQYELNLSDDPPAAIDNERINQEIAVNLTAPILLIHALLPYVSRPGGTIVNVSSLLSRQPKPAAAVYSATKAGLTSVTRSMRIQLADQGNRVLEVVPPVVDVVTSGLSRTVLLLNCVAPGMVASILANS